jgi:hypothetical protein
MFDLFAYLCFGEPYIVGDKWLPCSHFSGAVNNSVA